MEKITEQDRSYAIELSKASQKNVLKIYRTMKMASLHYLNNLDIALSETIELLNKYHSNESPYWNAIHEIMDDCYRLQDRVREDIREEKND